MMHMRPFQIILLAVFAVSALVGLYVFSTFNGFGTSAAQVGTVVIWGPLPQSAVDSTLNILKQGHKEYANVTYIEKRADTFDTELANALASGVGPDLIIINQEQLLTEIPKIQTIPYASIPQRTFLDTFLSLDQIYLNATGTYGIPITVDPLVLYYNRALLASAGVPTPPATWEAVGGLVPLITKQNGSQVISRSTIALGSYGNITNARAILSLLFLQAGSVVTKSTPQGMRSTLGETATSGGVATPAQAAVNFYTQFANPGKTVYSWNPSLSPSRQAFTTGDLALYIGYASELSSLKAANPNLSFDMAPIPEPGTSGTRKNYGLGYAFAIPKVSKNTSGAYLLATAFVDDIALKSLSASLGMAPAKRALLTLDPSNPYTAVYYPEALNTAGWLSPAPSAVDTIFSAMINNITSGRYDASQALTAADQSLNAAF